MEAKKPVQQTDSPIVRKNIETKRPKPPKTKNNVDLSFQSPTIKAIKHKAPMALNL